ncbi:MAG: SprB repeat-containing protein, partial [Saprospiraceae bacterium]|nr:SprB repeat-containing protein [Saprospiraceae bacterium]
MKGFYHLILICTLIASHHTLSAQCPPPGFPQPGNNCVQAPILCPTLDGYCATINNNNQAQNFPGCPGWQLNNDEWFAFYAGSTTITIQVTPSNCSQGNQMGLQAGIYAGCGPPWVAMDLQCACTTSPFVLTSTNFVIGQIYWFVIDGCAGNVCDYSIDVLVGNTAGAPPDNPGPVTAPATACAGTTTPVSIAPPLGATIYNWTVTPAGMGTVSGTGANVNVNWNANASGPAQVCVTVANACFPNNTPSCTTVNVIPKPTAMISGNGFLCAGSNNPANLTVNFTGQAPWQFVYTINGVPQPPIQTSNNPYTIMATQPGTYALQNVSSVTGGCIGTVSGSSTVTQVTVNTQTVVTNALCGQSTGAINLSVSGGQAPYTFIWSSGQITEDLSNIPPGSYTVTATDNHGCTKVTTVNVPDNIVNPNITGVVVANTTCNGGNGSIDVTVSPAGTYSYLWSNNATTQDLSDLVPGTYTVTVTQGVTCSGTASFTVPDQPNTPVITSNVQGTTCDL